MLTAAFLALAVGLQTPQVEKVDLHRAVEVYKQLNLPLPPAEAKLVGYAYGERVSIVNGKQQSEPAWRAGYLVEGSSGDPLIWSFETRAPASQARTTPVERSNIAKIDFSRLGGRIAQRGGLEFAVTEMALGNESSARLILERWTSSADESHLTVEAITDSLANFAVWYWMDQIGNREISREALLANTLLAFKVSPKAQSSMALQFVEALSATVNRYRGSDRYEKLVDALCDQEEDLLNAPHRLIDKKEEQNTPLHEILREGLGIVPTLFRHTKDNRFTWVRPMVSDRSFKVHTVGAICRQIIASYGGSTDTYSIGPKVDKANEVWWERATAVPFKDFVVEELGTGDNGWNAGLVYTALLKCPEALPLALDRVLAGKNEGHVYNLLKGIELTARPDVFRQAVIRTAQNDKARASLSGLSILQRIDSAAYKAALISALKRLPTSAKEMFAPEYGFANHVGASADPEVWQEFGIAARRAEPLFRAGLLQNLARVISNANTKLRLNCYLSFLDDRTSVGEIRPGTIGDIAAVEAARVLESITAPTDDAPVEAWAQFRENVRAAIKARN